MNTKVNVTELRSACPGLFFYFGGAVIYALMKYLGDVIVHLGVSLISCLVQGLLTW